MKLLKEAEVAEILNVTIRCLQRWRTDKHRKGKGPTWVKMGRAVRYPESELKKYIESLPTVEAKLPAKEVEEKKEEFDYWA